MAQLRRRQSDSSEMGGKGKGREREEDEEEWCIRMDVAWTRSSLLRVHFARQTSAIMLPLFCLCLSHISDRGLSLILLRVIYSTTAVHRSGFEPEQHSRHGHTDDRVKEAAARRLKSHRGATPTIRNCGRLSSVSSTIQTN